MLASQFSAVPFTPKFWTVIFGIKTTLYRLQTQIEKVYHFSLSGRLTANSNAPTAFYTANTAATLGETGLLGPGVACGVWQRSFLRRCAAHFNIRCGQWFRPTRPTAPLYSSTSTAEHVSITRTRNSLRPTPTLRTKATATNSIAW